jgi:uncharacterized membrane protein YozB (DUF420 family)
MSIADLPALNATLNAISAVLLVTGYVLIRTGRRELHKKCMLGALTTSACFLVSYLVYHANVGSRPFTGQGAARIVYFVVLLTHVVLAATILPLALVTTARGLWSQFDRHVRVARWTFPIWVYVSVTGVIVYVMLYQLTWA